MLQAIQRFFQARIASIARGEGSEDTERSYRLATAALLVEMSRADDQVKKEELLTVTGAIRRAFALSAAETDELVRLAEVEADAATSLHEFVSLINGHLSPDQKQHVVELLWQVAFADGELDKYEEHLVRRVAGLIHVPHREFLRAKHRVQERLGKA